MKSKNKTKHVKWFLLRKDRQNVLEDISNSLEEYVFTDPKRVIKRGGRSNSFNNTSCIVPKCPFYCSKTGSLLLITH